METGPVRYYCANSTITMKRRRRAAQPPCMSEGGTRYLDQGKRKKASKAGNHGHVCIPVAHFCATHHHHHVYTSIAHTRTCMRTQAIDK